MELRTIKHSNVAFIRDSPDFKKSVWLATAATSVDPWSGINQLKARSSATAFISCDSPLRWEIFWLKTLAVFGQEACVNRSRSCHRSAQVGAGWWYSNGFIYREPNCRPNARNRKIRDNILNYASRRLSASPTGGTKSGSKQPEKI